MLRVQLFAQARQLAGRPVVEIPWTSGETVLKLKQRMMETCPTLRPLTSKLLFAVNNDYAADDAVVLETDEVACFPPVSGG
jgi:molybdopterin converting factor small subunit